jgi:hypothetical protein
LVPRADEKGSLKDKNGVVYLAHGRTRLPFDLPENVYRLTPGSRLGPQLFPAKFYDKISGVKMGKVALQVVGSLGTSNGILATLCQLFNGRMRRSPATRLYFNRWPATTRASKRENAIFGGVLWMNEGY